MGMMDNGLDCASIFSQPWWLDAVAPGSWDEVTIEENGAIVARLPYTIQKHYGFTLLVMPPLTKSLGPWIAPHEAKYVTQLSREHKLMEALIKQLPSFAYFSQSFHPSITNWLPFHWCGFQQTTRYTYVINDLTDLDSVWKEMRDNIRRAIRKARKKLVVQTELDLETFLNLNEMTFTRQGLKLPYSRQLVARIDHACNQHNCRKILFAEDSQGEIHAVLYLVWDHQAAYYLMGGANPELRGSGATSLLMWEAIRFASTVTQSFDFEGSVIPSIERFFRAFGARQKPYFRVSKTNSLLLKMGLGARSWLEHWRGE